MTFVEMTPQRSRASQADNGIAAPQETATAIRNRSGAAAGMAAASRLCPNIRVRGAGMSGASPLRPSKDRDKFWRRTEAARLGHRTTLRHTP
jgi:hypothetical protein